MSKCMWQKVQTQVQLVQALEIRMWSPETIQMSYVPKKFRSEKSLENTYGLDS